MSARNLGFSNFRVANETDCKRRALACEKLAVMRWQMALLTQREKDRRSDDGLSGLPMP